MNIVNARSRMISVRLSQDEYTALVNLCAARGARSVSDLARNALRMLVGELESSYMPQSHAGDLLIQIEALKRRIEELNDRVTKVTNKA
jgi:plasmid stability protein